MIVDLKTTRVFDETIKANTRYVVNRGGGGSGKTQAVLQVIVTKFLTERNKRFIIIRKTLPALRDSTHKFFLELLDEIGIRGKVREEKQFLNYFYKDNEIRFRSLDNPDKIKSSEYSYAFLEEATELKYVDFEMVDMYLRKPSTDGKRNQIYLNFNPVNIFHWLKEKLIDKEKDLTEIVSNYKDNPFLSDDHRRKLENLINQNPNLYRVYTLGEWGVETNIIYENWATVDKVPTSGVVPVCFGVDFGFNDPIAMVKIYQDTQIPTNLYLDEAFYKNKLTTGDFINKINVSLSETDRLLPFYADSAEPDRIKEIRKAGYNIKPAKKGKGSIKDGIDFVKKFKLHVTQNSVNLIKELQSYSWLVDKDGDPIDVPIDDFNHLLDAGRYGICSGLNKQSYTLKWF